MKPDDFRVLELVVFEVQEIGWGESFEDDDLAEELNELAAHIGRISTSSAMHVRLRSDRLDALQLTPRQISLLHGALRKVLPELELFDEIEIRLATTAEHVWGLLEIIESYREVAESDRLRRPSAVEITQLREQRMAEIRRLSRLRSRVIRRGRLQRFLTLPKTRGPLRLANSSTEIRTASVAKKISARIQSLYPFISFTCNWSDIGPTNWARLETIPVSGEHDRLELLLLSEGYFAYKIGADRMHVRLADSEEEMETLAIGKLWLH